jgi:hypothetical protein
VPALPIVSSKCASQARRLASAGQRSRKRGDLLLGPIDPPPAVLRKPDFGFRLPWAGFGGCGAFWGGKSGLRANPARAFPHPMELARRGRGGALAPTHRSRQGRAWRSETGHRCLSAAAARLGAPVELLEPGFVSFDDEIRERVGRGSLHGGQCKTAGGRSSGRRRYGWQRTTVHRGSASTSGPRVLNTPALGPLTPTVRGPKRF